MLLESLNSILYFIPPCSPKKSCSYITDIITFTSLCICICTYGLRLVFFSFFSYTLAVVLGTKINVQPSGPDHKRKKKGRNLNIQKKKVYGQRKNTKEKIENFLTVCLSNLKI